SEHLTDDWRRALARLADDAEAHALLRGLAVRALYEQGVLDAPETGLHLSRALSRAVPPSEAGQWLDGFLGRAAQGLLYDPAPAGRTEGGIGALAGDDFRALLPMLRRAFASIARNERRRLLDGLRAPMRSAAAAGDGRHPAVPDPAAPGFAAALPLILTI